MPSGTFMMWGMLTVMALGAVAGPLVHGNFLGSLRAAYPWTRQGARRSIAAAR